MNFGSQATCSAGPDRADSKVSNVTDGRGRLLAKVGWYRNRLAAMTGRELLWRVHQTSKKLVPRNARRSRAGDVRIRDWDEALNRFRVGADRPVFLDRDRCRRIAQVHPDAVAQLIAAADSTSELSFRFFGYPAVTLEPPINWHYDPIHDRVWPDHPSHRIDHRSAGGDVKWIWELNRLQHLPWLAQAWLFTGDDRYSKAALGQLESWIEQNTPGRGIAWQGAFEAGIRAISVAIALQGLRDSPDLTAGLYRRVVTMLAESAACCWADRSLYSSANNHLVGEMAGLAVVAMIFPELRRAEKWEKRAANQLCTEASKQILADGIGAEQAVAYQLFTVELLHLVAVLMRLRGSDVPQPFYESIRRNATFLTAIVGDGNPPPRFGDDDGGFALRLGPDAPRSITDHLRIISGVCGQQSPAHFGSSGSGLDAAWFAELAQSAPSSIATPETPPRVLGSFLAPNGGLVVLRGGNRQITMDVGPLGYLSLAAHGHADALSVVLSADGHELISDPGTGSYYGHPPWRAVMRSTRAHPTVCVDGQDQSVAGGPFLWSKHAKVEVLGADLTAGVVDAQHDGYSRLPGDVIHRRWLITTSDDCEQALVVDLIRGTGHHEVRTNWPLHPSLGIDCIDGGYRAVRDRVPVLQLLFTGTARLEIDAVRGNADSNLGWWSDGLESRVPAWWLSARCEAELPLVTASLLSTAGNGSEKGLEVELREDETIHVHWEENDGYRSVSIRTDRPAAVEMFDPANRGQREHNETT